MHGPLLFFVHIIDTSCKFVETDKYLSARQTNIQQINSKRLKKRKIEQNIIIACKTRKCTTVRTFLLVLDSFLSGTKLWRSKARYAGLCSRQ